MLSYLLFIATIGGNYSLALSLDLIWGGVGGRLGRAGASPRLRLGAAE
jgi:hypothetical protein